MCPLSLVSDLLSKWVYSMLHLRQTLPLNLIVQSWLENSHHFECCLCPLHDPMVEASHSAPTSFLHCTQRANGSRARDRKSVKSTVSWRWLAALKKIFQPIKERLRKQKLTYSNTLHPTCYAHCHHRDPHSFLSHRTQQKQQFSSSRSSSCSTSYSSSVEQSIWTREFPSTTWLDWQDPS